MYSVNPEGNVSSYLEVAKYHKDGLTQHDGFTDGCINSKRSAGNMKAGSPRFTTRETKRIQNVPEPNMVQRHRRRRTCEGQRSCRSNMVQAGLEVPGTFQQDLGLTFQCGAIRPVHYSRAGASQARE